jgi:hypothetical protein
MRKKNWICIVTISSLAVTTVCGGRTADPVRERTERKKIHSMKEKNEKENGKRKMPNKQKTFLPEQKGNIAETRTNCSNNKEM